MGIKYTSSKNKNPMINFDLKQLGNQNPQKILCSKIMRKMHEKCMKIGNK